MRRIRLAELIPLSGDGSRVEAHVLFVHGLSGHIKDTWVTRSSGSNVLWPKWLLEDIPGLKVWLVGYSAAKTNWGGYGMPLSDRADNILARLLAEPSLATGNVIFVTHSLGGLVVEQLLRNAQRDAGSSRQAEDFLVRVRRVAFLGTPHRGALLANIVKAFWLVLRPSAATRDLVLGNPQLRDLNLWYRKYCQTNGIENLLLAEGRPEKVFGVILPEVIGTVVLPGSADAGLPELPITVDESHIGISKPASRDADVYIHVRDFIRRPFGTPPLVMRTAEALEKNATELQGLAERTQEHTQALAELKRTIAADIAIARVDSAIIDAEVERRLEYLRKCRLFGVFNALEDARGLVASLSGGNLASASAGLKGSALAWCARIIAPNAPDEAETILNRIAAPNAELSGIARALISASRNDLPESLSKLHTIGTPMARGVAYIIVLRAKGFREAAQWLQKAGLTFTDLDSDAKFFFLRQGLDEGYWDDAFDAAKQLIDADFARSPGLIFAAADAFLMQAVPDELRMFLMQYLPFDAANFPLRGDPASLDNRRTAMSLYVRMRSVAESLGLQEVVRHTGEKALWLRLMDPQTGAEAREELGQSIKDPAMFLRRLGLALQFGVRVDLEEAEQEVNRQTTLSGGMSEDAAAARFALALTKTSHAAAAAYVQAHREQLLQQLDWKAVYFFEIEMLASSGQTAQAEARLQDAVERGLTEQEITRLRRQLAEAAGSDPIAERLAIYEDSKSITDLRMLVRAYEDANNWQKVAEYGRTLLELTGDLADARRVATALNNVERHDEALAVFATYPALVERYASLSVLRAQTLYELGRLKDALAALQSIRQISDSRAARRLQIDLATASGDWESLQGFVESEWNTRKERTAIELLQTGQIAQQIGAARGKELIREAARTAPEDSTILLGCYHAASAAGWENSPEVHKWLEHAIELSGNDGPVRKVALEDIFELNPDWEKRESNAWDLLAKGDVPIFTAARILNRSLLSLYLQSALHNLDEPDVRKRPLVYSFSGAREKYTVDPRMVAMEPTALITAEFLGLFDICIQAFDHILIPHSTLGWLLEEKAKILFHQPSRVSGARELRRMVSEGQLRAFEGGAIASERLVSEVGETLAALLAEASGEHADTRQRLVVRGGPVHRANTFMREEADLKEFEPYLCSSFDVVEKLVQKGVLTTQEAEDARAALSLRERPWPSNPEIADGAVLYLDTLTVSHLMYVGLLQKLHRADITAVISREELEHADALIAYDTQAAEVVALVERLRLRLNKGLESGKVRLGTAIRVQDHDGPDAMMAHPTIAMLKLIGQVEAAVVDDRYVNQHASMVSETTTRPLLTTVDLLDILAARGAISAQRRQEARTTLRRANFALMPIDVEELLVLVNGTKVTDGRLVETAELKALRENVQRVRMTNVLQFPKELAWLNGVTRACFLALKEQWTEGLDEHMASARSDWLLELGDVRGWTHRLDENPQQLLDRYRNWVAMLMVLPVAQPDTVKEAYWRWFESRLLQSIGDEDVDSYDFLVDRAKEFVEQGVEAVAQRWGNGDE